jgi:hypothetical protein
MGIEDPLGRQGHRRPRRGGLDVAPGGLLGEQGFGQLGQGGEAHLPFAVGGHGFQVGGQGIVVERVVEARGQAQAAAAQAQQGHHHHHGQVVGADQAGVALGWRRQGGAGEPGIHQLMQALAQQGVPGVVAGAAQPDGGCGGLGARADAGQVVEQAGRAGRVRGRAGGPQIGAAAHVAGDVGVVGGRRGDGLPQPGQGFQQGLVDGVGEGVAHLAKPGGRGGDQVVGDGGGGGLGRAAPAARWRRAGCAGGAGRHCADRRRPGRGCRGGPGCAG